MKGYRDQLQGLGVYDYQIALAAQSKEGVASLRKNILAKFAMSVAMLPLAMIGALLHFIPFFLARWWDKATQYTEEKSQGMEAKNDFVILLLMF